MSKEQDDRGGVQGFQFANSNLNRRCNDVFSNLDALEKTHAAFERSRAHDDAESDRRLINETASFEDYETSKPAFRKPTFSGRDYHSSRKGGRHGQTGGRDEDFKKPILPPQSNRGRGFNRGNYSRGRRVPDYKLHPEKWTMYSLEDVDISDSSNKQAAFEFLNERKKLREGQFKEESVDINSTACSSGLFTFNQPKKASDTKRTKKNSSDKSTTVSSKDANKRLGDFEKMDDDGDITQEGVGELGQTGELKLESSPRKGQKRRASMEVEDSIAQTRPKLDINEISEDCEMTDKEEKNAGSKSRKFVKKSFRSRQRNDDDDGE